MKYTIRVDDITDTTFEDLKKFLDHERYSKYLVYREVADVTSKIHYQGFIEFDDIHVRWHRQRFQLSFPNHTYTKGHRSTALVKKDEYLVYVTKDKDLVLSKGCTKEFINSLETQSYKKILTPQLTQKVKNKNFTQEYLKAISTVPTHDRESIARQTILYFKENTKVFDKFIIRRFVNLAIIQDDNDNKDRYIDRMVQSIVEDW